MRKVVNLFKQFLRVGQVKANKKSNLHSPYIIPRKQHNLSRSQVSSAALKVLYRLHKANYAAYLVGGSVRDILLGLHPKDYDVVTDAHPEEIQRLFRNSFIIGRRFKLVHVRFGGEIIEVATFRGNAENAHGRVQSKHGLLLRDNVYGTLDADVWRRDFTVNALYYNIADFTVVDYTTGMEDLSKKLIRVIGDPEERYREDPARMLRALRLAAKLDFSLEKATASEIRVNINLLTLVPPARLFDKILKIFHSGKALATMKLWQEYGVFKILFPSLAESLDDLERAAFIEKALNNTDQRYAENKSINSAFLFAVFLWSPLQLAKNGIQQSQEVNEYQGLHLAMAETLQEQMKIMSIPRRFTTIVREIWQLQYHLENIKPRRAHKVVHHQRFRAAYDFLLLRSESHEPHLVPTANWWTEFHAADDEDRNKLIANRFNKGKGRRRKKKRNPDDNSVSSTGE